jgi:hypothetical protein
MRWGAVSSVIYPAKLAQDVFMRNAFATRERSAGAVECRRCFGRDLFLFHRSGSQRTRQRTGHHLKQVDNGGELPSVELIEELVSLLFFVRGYHQE